MKSNPKLKIDLDDIQFKLNDLNEKLALSPDHSCEQKPTIMILGVKEQAKESREKNNQRDLIEIIRLRLDAEMNGIETEYYRDAIFLKGTINDQLIMMDNSYFLIDKIIILNEEAVKSK